MTDHRPTLLRRPRSEATPFLRPVLIGAGVTVLGWLAVSVPLGVLAALRLPTTLTAVAFLLSALPPGVGAFVGARQAAALLDDRPSRAALGIAGPTILIVVSGFLVLLGLDEARGSTTVVMPLVGVAAGAWAGSAPRGSGR